MTTSSSLNQDVVVVGGGVIGLSCAWQLAREGIAVTVLEAGRIGGESSWAGAGVLAPCSWNRHDPMAEMLRCGIATYEDFVPSLQEAAGLDVEYAQCGKLELLYTDQHVRMARSEAKAAEGYGSRYGSSLFDVVSMDQARALEPNLAADALAVTRCHFTAQVRNPRLLTALRTACGRAGVRMLEGCPAVGLFWHKGRVDGIRCALETLRADHVVLCAGAWSGLVDERISALAPVYPVRGQIVLLRQEPPPIGCVVERGRCYLVPRRDGRILVGATEEHESGYDKSNTAEGVRWLLSEATALVPKLAEARLERTWSGLRPCTPDRRPVIGTHESCPGLIFATGHFRTGLALAVITGAVVRDLIVSGSTDVNLERCRPGRAESTTAKDRGDEQKTG